MPNPAAPARETSCLLSWRPGVVRRAGRSRREVCASRAAWVPPCACWRCECSCLLPPASACCSAGLPGRRKGDDDGDDGGGGGGGGGDGVDDGDDGGGCGGGGDGDSDGDDDDSDDDNDDDSDDDNDDDDSDVMMTVM